MTSYLDIYLIWKANKGMPKMMESSKNCRMNVTAKENWWLNPHFHVKVSTEAAALCYHRVVNHSNSGSYRKPVTPLIQKEVEKYWIYFQKYVNLKNPRQIVMVALTPISWNQQGMKFSWNETLTLKILVIEKLWYAILYFLNDKCF